ncbi:hypothetical protein T310_8683, partial [Rasamsonia emersonii CBS 393.64]
KAAGHISTPLPPPSGLPLLANFAMLRLIVLPSSSCAAELSAPPSRCGIFNTYGMSLRCATRHIGTPIFWKTGIALCSYNRICDGSAPPFLTYCHAKSSTGHVNQMSLLICAAVVLCRERPVVIRPYHVLEILERV